MPRKFWQRHLGTQQKQPSRWALKLAAAVLPETRGHKPQWELERMQTLASILDCQAEDNCNEFQKHVVISGVGRWKWALDATFDRPASFPNGEAGKLQRPPVWVQQAHQHTYCTVLGKSWIKNIKDMGYPFIHIADYNGNEDAVSTISKIYRVIGDNVAIVMLDYVAE